MRCPICRGHGRVFDGKRVEVGMGVSFERTAYRECDRCNGTGDLQSDDPAVLRQAITALEQRVLALEERAGP